MNILIIDDDSDFLHMASDYLARHGHQIAVMTSGFGVVNRAADTQTRPDLIVLDGRMPALNGESILMLLEKNREARKVPVLFYSNSSVDDESFDTPHPHVRVRPKGRLSLLKAAVDEMRTLFSLPD